MILNDSQKWLLFVGLISLVWLIYLLAPVLTPFLAAALLAYLGDPLVDRLEQRRFSRTLSVSIVFVTIFIFLTAMVLLLLPMLEHQLSYLLANIPRYIDFVQHDVLPGLLNRLG
ncbi:MAG: AI-2E family transporter, partial [Gammaproteobacteria bacterium]|nr:AI-2E family transporter [Gammaproteobacteria bacterium]